MIELPRFVETTCTVVGFVFLVDVTVIGAWFLAGSAWQAARRHRAQRTVIATAERFTKEAVK